MTRRIDVPIRVFLNPSGTAPAAFLWQRRRYRVRRVEACWKQMGPWWDGAGERTCFRVTAEGGPTTNDPRPTTNDQRPTTGTGTAGIYEILHDHASGRWLLTSVLD